MIRKMNIALWGNFSLLVLLILVNVFCGGIDDITHQTVIINDNGEKIPSQINLIILIAHTPITIDGNDDFAIQATSEGWSGNGSINNPYEISNYSISTTGGSGIMISNTNVYFIIENVTISGATNTNIGAFHLFNVINGELRNNTATDNYHGFIIGQSNGNDFVGNIIANNSEDGCYLFLSSNNTFIENHAINNGEYGFYLYSSCNYNFFSGNHVIDNTKSGFYLSSSSNNTLSENIVTNNFEGFRLSSSSNNTLTGNTATNNFEGFLLSSSNNNTINGNNVTDNDYYGIYLSSSNNNTLNNNNITYNSQYGLYILDATNNSIYLNIFLENNYGSTQAYSNSLNYWNNGTHGNFWSDYTGTDSNNDGIGDTAYLIDGDGTELDPYPLMTLSGFVIPEFSSSFLLLFLILGFISLSVLVQKKALMKHSL